MRKGFLASVAALAAGTGFAFGQPPAAMFPPGGSDPAPLGMTAGPPPMPGGGAPGMPYPIPPADLMPHNGYSPAQPGCLPGEGGPGGPGSHFGHGATGAQVHQHAGGPDCFFFDLEGMYFLFRPISLRSPLVTSGPLGSSGAIGSEGVTVIEGNENYGLGAFAGLRLNLGQWDPNRKWGYNISGFLTEQRAETDDYTSGVNQRTVLARPVQDVLTGAQTAVLVAFPAVDPTTGFSGSIFTRVSSRLGGVEANAMRTFIYEDRVKLSGIAGYRFVNLDEQIRVDSISILPATSGVPDDFDSRYIFDNFQTHNQFHGGQVGFNLELRNGRFFVDTTAKFALGVMHEVLDVAGETSNVVAGFRTTTPGGVLALESNSFKQTQNKFAFVPELNLKLGYNITQRISGYVGYNVLYMSNVIRPGEQITTTINPTTLPSSGAFNPQVPFGPAAPEARFRTTEFWAQGVNFGLSFRY